MPPPPAGPVEARVGPLTDEFVLAVAKFGRGRRVVVNGIRVRWVKGCRLDPLRRLAGSMHEEDVRRAFKRASAAVLDVYLRAEGVDFWPSADVWIRAERGSGKPRAEVFAIPPRKGAELPPAGFFCKGQCWAFSRAEAPRVAAVCGQEPTIAVVKTNARIAWCAQVASAVSHDNPMRRFHDRMMSLRRAAAFGPAPLPDDSTANAAPEASSAYVAPRAGTLELLPIDKIVCRQGGAMVALRDGKALVGFMAGQDILAVLGEAPASDSALSSAVSRRELFGRVRLTPIFPSWIPLALRIPLVRTAACPVGTEGSALAYRVQKMRDDLPSSQCSPSRLRHALDFFSLRGEDLRIACAALGLSLKDGVVEHRVTISKLGDLWTASVAGAITDGAELEDDSPPRPSAWESVVDHFLHECRQSPARSLWKQALGAADGEETHARGALVSPAIHPAFRENSIQVAGPVTSLKIEWTAHGAMAFSWCGATHAPHCAAPAWACAIRVGGTPVWENDAVDHVGCAASLADATNGVKRGARVDVAWGARGATPDVCVALRSQEHGMVVIRLAVR